MSIESWFYPLDSFLNWNRLYGKAGFVQYQCVLPRHSAPGQGLRKILEVLSRRRIGSFVAGLKSMRDDTVLLPFGMQGYTFGIDLDRRLRGLGDLLDHFDRIVLDHGGRVALSKDSRLAPATFRQMYPEYCDWIRVVERYATNRRFHSRLAQRLEL